MKYETIDSYIEAVRSELVGFPPAARDEELAELRSLLAEDAQRRGEAEAVRSLGDPKEYAVQLRASDHERDHSAPQGTLLGMPYDFRGASVERVGARIWNPADSRIFTPRLFGIGWTVNFGALAVRLGLIRPDDLGDESFERIPPVAVTVASAVPLVLALATAVLMAASWSRLPAEVPVHWGVSGAPDDFAPKALAFGGLFVLTVLPALVVAVRSAFKRPGARERVLSSAALALLATLGFGLTALTVADADGGASGNLTLLVIAVGFALSFSLLYVPARLGLRAEWREAREHEGEEA